MEETEREKKVMRTKQGSKEERERTMQKKMERERKRMQELLSINARGMDVIMGAIISGAEEV
jgi:hypothetical protein